MRKFCENFRISKKSSIFAPSNQKPPRWLRRQWAYRQAISIENLMTHTSNLIIIISLFGYVPAELPADALPISGAFFSTMRPGIIQYLLPDR